jgi:hypothetical protein
VQQVTVISASGRRIRIVQGVVDIIKGSIEVRVSDIIQFDEGIKKNEKKFHTLLGWMVGEPVGRTR